MNNRNIIILFVVIILVSAAGLFLLYSSKEVERGRRIQKELELGSKIAELTGLQEQLGKLTEQKKQSEGELNEKIETLNSLVREYEETIRAQENKLRALTTDSEAVKAEKTKQDKKIRELTQKIQAYEKENSVLLDRVKQAETQKYSSGDEDDETVTSMGDSGPAVHVPPVLTENEAVKLGDIVIQKASGNAATVQNVNKLYGFILVNAGQDEGLKKDDVLNIVRHKKLIGKAVVERTKDNMAAAVILPDWTKQEIKNGDLISRS